MGHAVCRIANFAGFPAPAHLYFNAPIVLTTPHQRPAADEEGATVSAVNAKMVGHLSLIRRDWGRSYWLVGCRTKKSSLTDHEEVQKPLSLEPLACGYDSLFDMVDSDGSGTMSLAEYLVWVTSHQLDAADDPEVLQKWIAYFYTYVMPQSIPSIWRLKIQRLELTGLDNRFDRDGDGAIAFDEMHRANSSLS